MTFLDLICNVALFPYQQEIARRIFFSLIIGDAEEITILCSRQAGKTEALACTAVTAMVVLPMLAKSFPDDPVLSKYRNGVMVGVFGPIDLQAETIFSRIKFRLETEQALEVLSDPDVNDKATATGDIIRFRLNKSFCQKQTAHPQAKIESKTYHLVIIDEAQDADSTTVLKSIHPMTVATAGTIVNTGTTTSHKSAFYESILHNKRRGRTNGQKNSITGTLIAQIRSMHNRLRKRRSGWARTVMSSRCRTAWRLKPES